MQTSTSDEIRETARRAYGAIATGTQGSCCSGTGCRGASDSVSRELGYSADDAASVPDGADLGLGCANPQAITALKPGERVLDLGSGAGFDAPAAGPVPPACCDSMRLEACCEPDAKTACCGASAAGATCGCQGGTSRV